jgi:hypothetical protein
MQSRKEQKAKLMGEAEAEIEKLLDWLEETDKPNLLQIEEEVLRIRKRIGEGMAREAIKHQATVKPVPNPKCPQCQKEMRYKGMKVKEITSLVGEVKLARGYYYCNDCESGLFPPGQAVRGAGEKLVREHSAGSELVEWESGQL